MFYIRERLSLSPFDGKTVIYLYTHVHDCELVHVHSDEFIKSLANKTRAHAIIYHLFDAMASSLIRRYVIKKPTTMTKLL